MRNNKSSPTHHLAIFVAETEPSSLCRSSIYRQFLSHEIETRINYAAWQGVDRRRFMGFSVFKVSRAITSIAFIIAGSLRDFCDEENSISSRSAHFSDLNCCSTLRKVKIFAFEEARLRHLSTIIKEKNKSLRKI